MLASPFEVELDELDCFSNSISFFKSSINSNKVVIVPLSVNVISSPLPLNPVAETTPEVFTRVTSVFPNCIVFDDVTLAFTPIAVALVRLFEISLLYPIAVLSVPLIKLVPAYDPIPVL